MADLCPPAAGLDVDAPDAEPEFVGSFAAEPAVLERVGSPERSFDGTAEFDPQETCREEISPDHVVGGRLQREWHRQG